MGSFQRSLRGAPFPVGLRYALERGGDADAVVVRRLGPTGLVARPLFKRSFSGGIAALGSGDVDGDGDRDVFAAVRLAGARKVDLWLLD